VDLTSAERETGQKYSANRSSNMAEGPVQTFRWMHDASQNIGTAAGQIIYTNGKLGPFSRAKLISSLLPPRISWWASDNN
jgi:hypothetical protein